MQFNFILIATALLASTSPVMSATLKWYEGAGCTGNLLDTTNGVSSGQCWWLTHGGSVKSIHYSDIPNEIRFFISGGDHDQCTNGSALTRKGSGCATAPTGVNWESVKLT